MQPILVEVTRGGRTESWHRGSFAVVDCDGRLPASAGDVDTPVFARSAVKPLQTSALVTSGAADHLRLTDAELAIACGSHAGLPEHVATVESMLAKAGRDATDLECGAHWPFDEEAARGLCRRGEAAAAVHNNCSGKHAGLICLSCFRGHDPAGYTRPDHPAMQEMTAALSAWLGEPLDERNRGIDGCSFPTYAVPLRSLALGFARFGTGCGISAEMATTASRLRRAMTNHPRMIAGPGRFDTRMIEACGGEVLLKSGAEGVACACIPSAGLGLAVKIDDGAARAAQVVMATLIWLHVRTGRNVSPAASNAVEEMTKPPILNWRGDAAGIMRFVGPLPQASNDVPAG